MDRSQLANSDEKKLDLIGSVFHSGLRFNRLEEPMARDVFKLILFCVASAMSLVLLVNGLGRGPESNCDQLRSESHFSDALDCYLIGAAKDNRRHQFWVAIMLDNGIGVTRNAEDALFWFNRAAELGDADAQRILGLIHRKGGTGPRNDELAAKWFAAAAQQGNETAQFEFGLALLEGRGVPVDLIAAVFWLEKASNQGLAIAQYELGVAYAFGKGVSEDQREALRLLKKAAGQDEAVAQFTIGLAYEYGRLRLAKNLGEAERWYRMAAEQGFERAQEKLDGLRFETSRI